MTYENLCSKGMLLSQRTVRCIVFAAICFVGTASAVAQQSSGLPTLMLIEPNDSAPGGLLAERDILVKERDTLRGAFDHQKAQCSSVNENDSAKIAFCKSKKQQLLAALNQHIQKSQAFNDAVKQWQVAERKGAGTFSLLGVFGHGEFYLVTSDGRKISGEQAHSVTIDNNVRAVTGRNGKMQVILPDETIFTLGPDSDMVLDTFVYDPSTSAKGTLIKVSQGTLRFVTGKITSHDPRQMKIKVAVGTIGVRGTELECFVAPDGAGYVKLFSGQLSFTANDGTETLIEPHQMISFSAKKEIKGPTHFE